MPYEIQLNTVADGWINTWSYDNGDGIMQPETFATREEAEAALAEFFQELDDQVSVGQIASYDRDEFRVQYVPHLSLVMAI